MTTTRMMKRQQQRRSGGGSSSSNSSSHNNNNNTLLSVSTGCISLTMITSWVVVVLLSSTAGVVVGVNGMSPEEYMNLRSTNGKSKQERLDNAIDLETQYKDAIVKAAEDEEKRKAEEEQRLRDEEERAAKEAAAGITLLNSNGGEERKRSNHRHHNNEPQVHYRIDGLTPYEEQEVVTWHDVLNRFPYAFEANMESTVQMAQNAVLSSFADGGKEWQVPNPPYISLGYAKEGSTSINLFFNCLGHKSCHYFSHRDKETMASCFEDAKTNGQPLLKSCGYPNNCDAFAQMEAPYVGLVPQLEHLYDIILEEPNATLLYPVRNFTSWLHSQTKWTVNHDVPDMVRLRDANCPFVGLEAFDTNSYIYGAARNKELFLRRQKEQQEQFVKQINDPNTSEETRTIYKALDSIRGIDDEARLAIFRVYHTTFVREFAIQNHVTLIEFNLEDERTGDLLTTIFNGPKNGRCWHKQNSAPPTEVAV